MKFTIIMPTYNDKESIIETLDSLIAQSYTNWELLISDDGSTDNTKEVITQYLNEHKENRIKYFYQENKDQLNAILNVIDKITGDYVHVLHSDDLLATKNILSDVKTAIENDSSYDAYIAKESYIINEDSQITGKQYFPTYQKKQYILPLELLWLGRNFYWDFAFFKTKIFKTEVKNNYLIWNTPFWLNYCKMPTMLNVKTLDFSFIDYRVFSGNYINNEIGKLNVINGELRNAANLMKHYYIPFYKTQYFIFRTFNKLKLLPLYRPIYFKQESKHKDRIIKFIIQKRYQEEYLNYPFLTSLINFYKNYQRRSIVIKEINPNEFIYRGCDMRKFNNKMLKKELSPLYLFLFKEMDKGFDEIETTAQNKEKVENIIKFLCLYPFVKITVKGELK